MKALALWKPVLIAALLVASASSSYAQVVVRSEEDPPNAYAIGIGDVIDISVWKNPELSVTVPVRPDGRVSVPLLGDIQAAGMTPRALTEDLTQRFKEFVTAPSVSVVIKEIHSRKVFVTGEVATPGAYDLQPRTKLMQVLAMAGGLTPYAKRKVVVLRDGATGKDDKDKEDTRFEYDLDAIISGKRPEFNIVLQPGDTLIFP
ncbi:MAG TPA: polysaccharide biosynthesis/export family protein [Thermoanaerobaculia bacterium]|jgi:polysaccharide export outer membrane protein|nr:polysaccharide biosynthesis/export family protein [Thermoanaerobaculia bacterium]